MQLNAENLMLIGGISAFLLTIYWVRGRDLREKYAVIWIAVALAPLVCGIFPGLIMQAARKAHLAYPSAVLLISLAAIYVFSFSVSVSLTRQYRRNVRLMQELALMEQRIRVLERAASGLAGAGAEAAPLSAPSVLATPSVQGGAAAAPGA